MRKTEVREKFRAIFMKKFFFLIFAFFAELRKTAKAKRIRFASLRRKLFDVRFDFLPEFGSLVR